MKKIVLFGSCSFSYLFREMIRLEKEMDTAIDWRVVILTWRHFAVFDGIVPKEHIFYPAPEVNDLMSHSNFDLSELRSYPGSLIKDIGADKGFPGMLRTKPKEYQLKNAMAYYRVYKRYLEKEKPYAIFLPMIETHDGMVMYKAAVELGIKTLFHCSTRNIGYSLFSSAPHDVFPPYGLGGAVPIQFREQAEKFIDDFRRNPCSPLSRLVRPQEKDIVPFGQKPRGLNRWVKLPMALVNLVRDQIKEPHAGRANPIIYQAIIQFWKIHLFLQKLRGKFQRHYFDVRSLDQLPKKFIYFPMHVVPELSINSYAPYFEDQMRLIDLILLSMPNDCYLVAKEHPAMHGRRPNQFYETLKKKAGLILVDYEVPGVEILKRAALTVSITGTACLEAFLFGRPAMVFGPVFFAPWIAQFDSMEKFGRLMRETMAQTPDQVREKAVDMLGRIFMVGNDYVIFDPHDPGLDWEYTMNVPNVKKVLLGMLEHLEALAENEGEGGVFPGLAEAEKKLLA